MIRLLSLLVQFLPLIIIIRWLCKIKTGEKFPPKTIAKFLVAGALSLLLNVLTASPLYLHMRNVTDIDPLLNGLILTLFTAAIPEECSKYILFRAAIRKEKSVRVWFDAILACGIVGIGFCLLEDAEYLLSDGVGMMIRGLFPFHFIFAVAMGYFYGKAVVTGEGKWHVWSLAVPVLLHSLLDYTIITLSNWHGGEALSLITEDADFSDPTIITVSVLMGLLFVIIILFFVLLFKTFRNLNRWRREERMQALLNPAAEETVAPADQETAAAAPDGPASKSEI